MKKLLVLFLSLNIFLLIFSNNAYSDKSKKLTKNEEIAARQFKVYKDISSKKQKNCPNKKDTIVIVGIGQSNSTNEAPFKNSTERNNIFNFFNGECYLAEDPLLGASGRKGSVWIPLAEKLTLNNVVIVSFGIGATKIEHWVDENILFNHYIKNIRSLKNIYPNPDFVFWIQGESDVKTNITQFKVNLTKFMKSIKNDLPQTEIFITGTSYCNGVDNLLIVAAQKKVANNLNINFIEGMDDLNSPRLRYEGCHFNELGIEKLSELLANSLKKHFRK